MDLRAGLNPEPRQFIGALWNPEMAGKQLAIKALWSRERQ
jgi:hypothetical protein